MEVEFMDEKETGLSTAVPVRLTQEQLHRLDMLKAKIGAPTRSDVIRWLINNTRVRQASAWVKEKPTAPNMR
jgi:hypothetical protein